MVCVGTGCGTSIIFIAAHRLRRDFRDIPASSLGNFIGPCDDRSQYPWWKNDHSVCSSGCQHVDGLSSDVPSG